MLVRYNEVMSANYSAKEIQGFKWPIKVTGRIAASPQKVWKVISSPGNLDDCHPFCEKNPVDQWSGVGSKDTIHYYSGWVLQREFLTWIDGVGYDLIIGRDGGRQSYVSWRITEEGDNESQLSITLYPHVLQKVPVIIRWIPHITTVRPAMQSYLESVVKGFEYFITTGKPVKENQFGSHPWFSSKNS
jgi:hypothetical protein